MRFCRPMLDKEVSRPFSDGDWVFEVKWDGFRAITYVGEPFGVRSRNRRELLFNLKN